MSKVNGYINDTRELKDYNFMDSYIDELIDITRGLGFNVGFIPVYSSRVESEVLNSDEQNYIVWDEHLVDQLRCYNRNIFSLALLDLDKNTVMTEFYRNRILRNMLNLLSWDLYDSPYHSLQMAIEYRNVYEQDMDKDSNFFEIPASISDEKLYLYEEITACNNDVAVLFVLIHELMHIRYMELTDAKHKSWGDFVLSICNVRYGNVKYSRPGSEERSLTDDEYYETALNVIDNRLASEELYCDYNAMRIVLKLLTHKYRKAKLFTSDHIRWCVVYNALSSINDFLIARKVCSYRMKKRVNLDTGKEVFYVDYGGEVINRHILCGELINRDYYERFWLPSEENFIREINMNHDLFEIIYHLEEMRNKHFATQMESIYCEENLELFINHTNSNKSRMNDVLDIDDIDQLHKELLRW